MMEQKTSNFPLNEEENVGRINISLMKDMSVIDWDDVPKHEVVAFSALFGQHALLEEGAQRAHATYHARFTMLFLTVFVVIIAVLFRTSPVNIMWLALGTQTALSIISALLSLGFNAGLTEVSTRMKSALVALQKKHPHTKM